MGTSTLALLFIHASITFQLPPGMLSALCWVESSHNVSAYHSDDGKGNSVGVCQVKLDTARYLGFKGTEEQLLQPKVNTYYAAKMIRRQLDRYDGDLVKAFAAYNAGTYLVNSKGSVVNALYVRKVLRAWGEDK